MNGRQSTTYCVGGREGCRNRGWMISPDRATEYAGDAGIGAVSSAWIFAGWRAGWMGDGVRRTEWVGVVPMRDQPCIHSSRVMRVSARMALRGGEFGVNAHPGLVQVLAQYNNYNTRNSIMWPNLDSVFACSISTIVCCTSTCNTCAYPAQHSVMHSVATLLCRLY